jgi:chromosome segregation ATPase
MLLDEIDAALDENNSNTIGLLVKRALAHKQVVCISHHAAFQRHSNRQIHIAKQSNSTSAVVRVVNKTIDA